MKRVLIVLLIAAFAMPAFVACKKGKNDPAISLKSRKSRLVGEWKLSEGTNTIVDGANTVTLNYNGSTVSASTGGSVSYTQTVVVNKDGTWESTIMQDGDLQVNEGQWYFMDANKDNDIKSKECVAFVRTRTTTTPAGGTPVIVSYTSVVPDIVWKLDKLSSKEIVAIIDFTQTGTSTYSEKGSFTYEKK